MGSYQDAVLFLVRECGMLTTTQIAELLDLGSSRVHRACAGLMRFGLLDGIAYTMPTTRRRIIWVDPDGRMAEEMRRWAERWPAST